MTPPASDAKFSLARAALLSLVAGLVAALFWCGVELRSLRGQVAVLETERDLAIAAHQLAASQLAERTLLAEGMINDLRRQLHEQQDPARLMAYELTPPDGGAARGVLLWHPRIRAGSFAGTQLPAPAPGETYTLWLTDAATQARINLGVIQVPTVGKAALDFRLSSDVSVPSKFSVTVEATGPAALSRVILAGK